MGNGEYLVDFSFSIEKIMMPSDEIGKIMMEMGKEKRVLMVEEGLICVSLFPQLVRIAGLLGSLRAAGLCFHNVFQGILGLQI